MKYRNSKKGLFGASLYYRGGEQQQSIGAHFLFVIFSSKTGNKENGQSWEIANVSIP